METKGILRMVLRMVFLVILGVMTSGSSCDKKGNNPAGDSSPNIYVNSDKIAGYDDFGDLLMGQEVEYMFIIGNNGTAKLTYNAPVIGTPYYGIPQFEVVQYIYAGGYKKCDTWDLEGYHGKLQPGEECAFIIRFQCYKIQDISMLC